MQRERTSVCYKKVLDAEKSIGQELSGPISLSFVMQALPSTSESILCVSFCHELTCEINTAFEFVGKV